MVVAEPSFAPPAFAGDGLDARDALLVLRFRSRQDLLPHYRAALANVLSKGGEDAAGPWMDDCLRLSDASAGPALLISLWRLERRTPPDTGPVGFGGPVLDLCRHAGAARTRLLLDRLMEVSPSGTAAEQLVAVLAAIAEGACQRPDIVQGITAVLDRLIDAPLAALRAWIDDGLRLTGSDRRRRDGYFSLADPLSRERLAWHCGAMSFRRHEKRLAYLTRLLWDQDLTLSDLPERSERTRLAGGVILVPPLLRDLDPGSAERFAEAAILHAEAHRRFTLRRFEARQMKPLQMALTCLFEDARVERLAAGLYPGLAGLWASHHRPPPRRSRTSQALLARLAQALTGNGVADPDPDQWIVKCVAMFEDAFRAAPDDQSLSERIARIAGHDLGQMRIPFDARLHRIEPAYRDDGIGLFDVEASDPEQADTAVMMEAARVDAGSADDPHSDASAEPMEHARMRPEAAGTEIGARLAEYPEWDYRIRSEQHGRATVFAEPVVPASSGRLADDAEASERIARRLAGQLRRSRLGRPQRLRRQQEGEDLDIDALQDLIATCRVGGSLDLRIHQRRIRPRGDVAVGLLLDASQSTGDRLHTGRSILETAALSVALLASALEQSSDPCAVYGFRSNGRDEVRIVPVKGFDERAATGLARLAALRPAYSTRLGAAIRHVTAELGRRNCHRKVLIVMTDGEPADIDIDDPHYLLADARRAVLSARAEGLDIFCVSLGDQASAAARSIFGQRNTLDVAEVDQLPSRLAYLYHRLTVA